MGSSRRELFSTSSAFAAAIRKVAAVPSAARAADHSAATSPTFGDFVATGQSRHDIMHALVGTTPAQHGEMTSAVEFLLFTASPETVSDTHIKNFSGAM